MKVETLKLEDVLDLRPRLDQSMIKKTSVLVGTVFPLLANLIGPVTVVRLTLDVKSHALRVDK